MPVLMSAPNADAPRLARVELGDETLTFELHYPTGEVDILPVGFKGGPHRYCLAETGYSLAVDPGDVPMFLFLVEATNGKRYRWYVHDDDPCKTFIQISAHMKAMDAKATPKFEAAIIPNVLQQAA